MGETGIIVRFPGNLDPRAQEFRPTYPNQTPLPQPATLYPLPHPYAQTPCPYPYTYLPSSPAVLPSHDAGAVAALAVPYAHFSAPAPSATYSVPPPQPPLPPPRLSTSPTRSLLLTHLPSDLIHVSESSIRRDLEVFGDVRGVQMESLRNGIVTVHFYDLRDAETALTAIRRQHMQQQTRLRNYYATVFVSRTAGAPPHVPPHVPPPAHGLVGGRAVWAQYVIPSYTAVPDGQNQGTIVVFNLDSAVSADNLQRVFEAFGPVKELRDTPLKKYQRFVEFYDVRDAAKALKQMNGKEIHGKEVVIEFSRPGGQSRKFSHPSNNKPLNLNVPNSLPPPNSQFYSSPRKYSRRFGSDAAFAAAAATAATARSCSNSSSSHPQLPLRKRSTGCSGKESPRESPDVGSVEAAMGSMSLGEGIEEDPEEHFDGPARRNSVRKENSESGEGSVKHQQQMIRSRNWKGKQAKKHETKYLIRDEGIVESSSRDPRTTVMIKNIPNKYSQKLLLNMLDNHCIHCNEQIGDSDDQPLSSYDFVYLPIDFNNKCNVGYGFVNMTSPEATLRLYKAFHLQQWEVFNSRKICEVTYARVQGLEALKEHFKNSKFPCEMEHYLPVVFSPPRDGRSCLTEPLPIVGNGNTYKQHQTIIPPSTIAIPHSTSSSDDIECHYDMASAHSSSASASEDVIVMLSSSSQSGGGGGVCDSNHDTGDEVAGGVVLLLSDDTKSVST